MNGTKTLKPRRGHTARCSWLIWGEIPNWEALVDDSRHELLDEGLDYLMEPWVCAIYRRLERWPVNLDWARWRSKKE